MAEPAALLASTGYLLARLGAESRRRFVQALPDHDLGLADYGVLMVLAELGSASQRRLADLIGVDPRNAVAVIDRLEARGWLVRAPDSRDRRRHSVRLTETGRKGLGGLRQVGQALERDMLGGLAESEQEHLHGLLLKLLASTRDDPQPGR